MFVCVFVHALALFFASADEARNTLTAHVQQQIHVAI